MNQTPLHSRKKNSSANKTEPSASQKKYLMLNQLSNNKPTIVKRQNSPTLSDLVKSIPNNMIYDKQTLYMEVQELKKIINKLINENTKLKTRISVLLTEKDRLDKSREFVENEERSFHRTLLNGNSSHLKNDVWISQLQNLKSVGLKKQIKQLKLEIEYQKNENSRLKRTVKYAKINELQLQIKTLIEENKYLYGMYQQVKSKAKTQIHQFAQYDALEKRVKKLSKQKQLFSSQIQHLNIQIMNLQSQLRKQKAQRNIKQVTIKNELTEEKRVAAIKLKQILDFRRQNSSMIESKIRTTKAKEKLQNTSFKSHHVHIQPIRKNNIFADNIQKLQQIRNSSLSLSQKSKAELLDENHKLKSELSQTERKLKQMQEKAAVIENIIQVQSKPSAMFTLFSQNLETDSIVKQQQRLSQKQQVSQPQERYKPNQLEGKQDKNNQGTPKTKLVQVRKNVKKSHSQKNFEEQKQQDNEHQQHRIKTQYLKQKINLDMTAKKSANKNIIKDIRLLLTYRFKYQKYKFVDLKKDIESSNAKEFSYIDVCHMLVNEPFYLNLIHCRILASFIFNNQKPKHQQKVQTSQLLIKLRKIIKDYQDLPGQKQFSLLQKCVQLIKTNQKSLISQFQSQKNEDKSIQIVKLTEILKKFGFGSQEIEYMITQVSINMSDLQHIPYELILQRFSINQSQRSSKQEIIFQKGEEENSNLNNSQNDNTSRSFVTEKQQPFKEQNKQTNHQIIFQPAEEASINNKDAFQEVNPQNVKNIVTSLTENIPKG